MSASPEASKINRLLPPLRQHSPAAFIWRRQRTATVRLGGRRRSWVRRGGRVFVGTLRRIKLRWASLQCARALKKLRYYYAGLLWELVVGAAAMEGCFGVPAVPAVAYCNAFH